jgi:hypothetical protein
MNQSDNPSSFSDGMKLALHATHFVGRIPHPAVLVWVRQIP